MTESYNPKIVEKAAQSFWHEKNSFAVTESEKPKRTIPASNKFEPKVSLIL